MKSGRQPRPSNWKIDKCIQYLLENPIPTSEVFDLDWIESKLKEWKRIQEMVNKIESIDFFIDFSLIDDIFLNAFLKNVVEGFECDVVHSVGMLEERTILVL